MTAWFVTCLWQGTAVAIAVSISLRMLPRVNAATRYVIWWGALIAVIWAGCASAPGFRLPLAATVASEGTTPALIAFRVRPLPDAAIAFIVGVWLTIALFRLVRILPGLTALHRLKETCRPLPTGVEDALPMWWAAKNSGRRARLMLCNDLAGAAVLGLWDPCIAFPSSLLEVARADELDQIIVHEYGHVQRRDDWTRLAQALVEAAVWIHPAASWIGRQLNLEREVACDDWVVSQTGAPRAYADCLSRLAEAKSCPARAVCAPALFGSAGQLLRRVDRLLSVDRNTSRRPSLAAASIGLTAVATIAVNLGILPLVAESVAPMAVNLHSTRQADSGRAETARRQDVRAADVQVAPIGKTGRPAKGERPSKRSTTSTIDVSAPIVVATLEEVVSPEEREIPSLPVSRSFHGTYRGADSSATSETGRSMPAWRLAGNAGIGIGKVARNAGTGLASAFSRAGVSLARGIATSSN